MAQKQGQKKHTRSVFLPLILLFLILALLAGAVGCRKREEPNEPVKPPVVLNTVRLWACMTESDNEEDLQTTLSVDGMRGMQATTLADIKSDITHGVGDKSDRANGAYFAFSFYLFNKSDCDVSYEMSVNVVSSTGTVLDAVRVMVIENDKSLAQGDVYAKAESTEEGRNILKEKTSYSTQSFVSDRVICTRKASGFKKDTKVKQTFLVWLEGWDVDCNNGILSQSFSMNISVEAKAEDQTV